MLEVFGKNIIMPFTHTYSAYLSLLLIIRQRGIVSAFYDKKSATHFIIEFSNASWKKTFKEGFA